LQVLPTLRTHHNVPMTAPWIGSMTPIAPPSSANPKLSNLLYAGLVTGAWSGVASLVLYAVGQLFGVPFAGARGLDAPVQVIPWFIVLLTPLAAALIGAALASLLLGRRHSQRIVFWVGTLIALASCASPILQPATVPWSARILLLLMHVITWILVVPQIARIVGDAEPGASVDRTQ
jgi:hypothetical protein